METKTYTIPESNMEWLKSKIEKLNRRAVKLGQSFIEIKIVEEEMVEYKQSVDPSIIPNFVGVITYKKFFKVEIIGQAPVVAGWSFVGSIEHEEGGNILKLLPNQIIPENYRKNSASCDHCKIDRFRNSTFILNNGTEYKQIGRSCLQDFVGQDVVNVISRATILASLDELGLAAEDEDIFGHISSGKQYYNLKEYLSNVVAVVEKEGFISKKKAQELEKTSTADIAFSCMTTKGIAQEKGLFITSQHSQKAKDILSWLEVYLNSKTQLNEYEHNLQVILEREFVSYSTLGFAASIVSLHYREITVKAEQEAQKPSEYIGEIGKRVKNLKVILKKVIPLGEGTFGMKYLYKFEEESGNVLVWFTTNVLDAQTAEFIEGRVYKGAASVKEHSLYNGLKQTVVTRCKFEAFDGYKD